MTSLRKLSTMLVLLLLGALLGGCGTMDSRRDQRTPVAVDMAPDLLEEVRLLDVWIELFEPGPLPEDDDERRGITPEIRKAESRFIPVHLKNTLQRTGYWGAVRVVPKNAGGGELTVKGRILESDGETLALHIRALDSRGEVWLDETYRDQVLTTDYDVTERGEQDAFQNLYNNIANDLAEHKADLEPKTLGEIRRVAELRFAGEMAPAVFQNYLRESDGRYLLKRLPSEQDPMLMRIRTIRERDYLLIDTVNDHYDGYYRDIWEPYGNWRQFRMEEEENLRKVEREAMTRKVLGIGAVLGAIALEVLGGRSSRASTAGLRSAMLIGGAMAAKSGFDMDNEARIHIDAIEELDVSFESEASPMVIDVEGETHKLTGSAEDQYTKWRELLHRIHVTETGFTVETGRTEQPAPLY